MQFSAVVLWHGGWQNVLGYRTAVDILKSWLEEYRRDLGRRNSRAQSAAH